MKSGTSYINRSHEIPILIGQIPLNPHYWLEHWWATVGILMTHSRKSFWISKLPAKFMAFAVWRNDDWPIGATWGSTWEHPILRQRQLHNNAMDNWLQLRIEWSVWGEINKIFWNCYCIHAHEVIIVATYIDRCIQWGELHNQSPIFG